MNTTSQGPSPSAASRISRGIGAAALTTVLIVGLAGCMTGRTTVDGPEVADRNAQVPAGVDMWQPADRVAEQLAHQAAVNQANSLRFAGRPADRVAEELARQAGGAPIATPTPTNPYPGMTADRIDRMVMQAQ